jgi:serine/threonine-protein kinase
MPRLLIEKGPDRGKSATVSAGQQLVAGRDKSADLQLSDNMASRRHFMIASKGSIFGLKDLSSANGTLVNGRRADGATRLQYGDSIQVGETLISWLSDEQAGTRGMTGQVVGGYRIEERLGRGAMGTVFKATQLSLGRTIALKVLAHELTKDAKFCEMFLKEARAAGSLNHPNIIQVYDVGDEKGSYYFSMEFAAKGSVLDELQERKTIALPRAVRIIRDACSALDYAERKGLVHRDIKPDNLMVMEDDTVKLGDLGLAMSTVELQAEQDGVFGTPHYIAPEQAMGKPIDHRADIYALGATFYRMLSGRTMFSGATVKEILKKQVREPHPPITEFVHDCPEGIRRILDSMLVKNPAERYQHASEVASDLADYENLASRRAGAQSNAFAVRPAGLGPDQSQRIAQGKARRNLVLAAISALLAVAAAVTVLWFFVFAGAPTANHNRDSDQAGETNSARPPDNGKVEDDAQVISANKHIDERIGVAKEALKRASTKDELEVEIELIERSLQGNHRASPDRIKELSDLRDELKRRLEELAQGIQEASADLDTAGREANGRIAEFRFEAAKQPLADFIAKWKDSKNPQVKALVEIAETQLNNQPVRCQSALTDFEKRIRREAEAVLEQQVELRAAAMSSLARQVREAETACDEPVAKGRLGELAKDLERRAAYLQEEAARVAKLALEQAFTRASASLNEALELSRQRIARGDFRSAGKPLEDWELKDPDYLAHGTDARFARIRADLLLRRQQTVLEFESLRILSESMPRPIDQIPLLRRREWPADVAKVLGDPTARIAMSVNREIADAAWMLQVVIGTNAPRNMTAAEYDTPQERRALAGALAHMFSNSQEMRDGLMKATPGGPPAILGVFAWLYDLEAYGPAAVFIEHAWENVDRGRNYHGLVSEYYAWSLLGRANEAALADRPEEANRFLERLSKEFPDSRANKGR